MSANLVMFRANGQRKDFPLGSKGLVIGRAEKCGLRIPLLSVSRRHCQIAVAGERIKVKDLASSNGTYVNNKRVNEAELSAGDRLVVGPIVFTVQVDGKPEEIQPVKTRGQRLAEKGTISSEEVVDLEADISAELGAPGLDETTVGPAKGVDQSDEPVSALEAIAAELEENEDKDKGKGKK